MGAKKFDLEEILPFHLVEHARDLRKLRGLPDDFDAEIFGATIEDQQVEIDTLRSDVEDAEKEIKHLEARVAELESERAEERREGIAVAIVAWGFVLRDHPPAKKKRATR